MTRKSDGRTGDQRDREAYRAADLLNSGYQPKPSDLAKAPILEDWSPVFLGLSDSGDLLVLLTGTVTGHPTLRDGKEIRTSVLIGLDEKAGWARTWGRYYKLGTPHVLVAEVEEDVGPDLWENPYFPGDEPDDSDDKWRP